MDTVIHQGQDCCALTNGVVDMLVTRSVGPRILSLNFERGANLLAELPDFSTECPGSGTFHFYGGHRLWHAPEDPALTYLPDDSPVQIVPIDGGLRAIQEVEAKTGLQKSIEIRLPAGSPRAVITHSLANRGLQPLSCAPWAITQFRTGGRAILPQTSKDTGVLPNRSLTFWPYTDPGDPNVDWGRRFILVNAAMLTPFKIGFPNPRGWLAYWLEGTLFVKRAAFDPRATYPDLGSSSECYCNDEFVELETLGPLASIRPGEAVVHVETWELYRQVDCPRDEQDAQSLMEQLGLERTS